VVWGLLLGDYYAANTVEYPGLSIDPPRLWAIFVSNLAGCLMLSWLFSSLGVNNFASGFQRAAIIFFLFSLSIDMMWYALMNFFSNYTIIIVDVIVSTLVWAIVGGVIAIMLGRSRAPAPA
jgi:hypothetical protein